MKYKLSKIIALALALCMVMTMLPLAAFATTADGSASTGTEGTTEGAGGTEGEGDTTTETDDGLYDIWVGKAATNDAGETVIEKVQVTKDNAADVLGDATADTAPTVAFDPETKTLTLTDAVLSDLFEVTVGSNTYYCGLHIGEAVTVELAGANEITASSSANVIGLMNGAAVEFTGTGSLAVTAEAKAGYAYGIYSTANITVNGCSVNVTGTQNAVYLANAEALLNVKAGALALTATNDAALLLTYGGTKKQLQIDGGEVTITSKQYGVANSSGVKTVINGGTVTVTGSEAFGGTTAPDISAYKNVSITAGTNKIFAEQIDTATVTDWHKNKYVLINETEKDNSDIGGSDVTVEGGVATIAPIDKGTIADAIAGGANALTLHLADLEEAVTSVIIPVETLEVIVAAAEAAENANVTIVIELSKGNLELDLGAMSAIIAQAGNTRTIQIFFKNPAEPNADQLLAIDTLDAREVFEVYIIVNGAPITDLQGGTITVSVPCDVAASEVAAGYYITYLPIDGGSEELESTWNGKMRSFEIDHLSVFALCYDVDRAVEYKYCTKDHNCPMSPFSDTRIFEWYHDGVHFCLDNGIMQGYANGLFGTGDPVTRGQLVTMLWRLEGCPETTYAIHFDDISAKDYYYDAVRWAMSEEIIQGYNDKTFAPKDNITREQLVVIMWRYARYKGGDMSVGKNVDLTTYSDYGKISNWATNAMQWAVATGLIQGVETEDGKVVLLQPKNSASRAQIATILMRYCEGTIPSLTPPTTPPAGE